MMYFERLYNWMNRYAKQPTAVPILAFIAFIESSFFPLPPDLLLVPMGVSRPNRALYLAFITTIASVLGGVLGYFLGYLCSGFVLHAFEYFGYQGQYHYIAYCFQRYGVWMVILAGVTPIPYKLFTLSAGLMHMAFIPFVIASFIGRGLRFIAIGIFLQFFGDWIDSWIQKNIARLMNIFCVIGTLMLLIYIVK